MPYLMGVEYLGPLLEVTGFAILPGGWALGLLHHSLFLLFVAAGLVYGLCLSLATLLLEEITFRRYREPRHPLRLTAAAISTPPRRSRPAARRRSGPRSRPG